MTLPKHPLLLIDGHAVLFRSFHALPPLKTKTGIPTNAIYGFITTLLKALDEFDPKYCAVAFDLSGPTFRHQAFDGYKANRASAPDELKAQIPYAYQVVEALNIPIFTKEGFEADDVIGTLATQAKQQKIPTIIVTGDKDSFQLVNDTTFVYTMKRTIADTVVYDRDGVIARMGVSPEQIPDFKALAGDASDEIPGISGIGEKTAVTILSQVASIEALYEHVKKNAPLSGITPRIYTKIVEGEEIARKSKELATIDCNVPITLDLQKCTIHDYDPAVATALFTELEFYSLIKRLPQSSHATAAPTEPQTKDWTYSAVVNEAELTTMLKSIGSPSVLAVDTETASLDGPIIGISLADSAMRGYYIAIAPAHGSTLTKETVGAALRPLLTNSAVRKVGHNIKYDAVTLRQIGITIAPISFDTMVAAYILHAHLRAFDFDTVAQRELGYKPISFADVAGSTKKTATLLDAPLEKVAEYAAEDAVITYRLYETLAQQLHEHPELEKIATTIDFPLIPVLQAMEHRGMCLDRVFLEKLGHEVQKDITTLKTKIEQYAKGPINVNSPVQLQKLLFEELKLEATGIKSTQNGLSTAASELEKLQGLHPVIDDILKYRELTKLHSTYIATLPDLVDDDGRVHTQFSQTTAATGRLSSSDPNLQNIPTRTELGKKIRTAFTAPTGYDLISLDYSQMELRIIAHLAQDPTLIQVFRDGRDIHAEVAKQMGVDRRAAKAINFGIIYGLSAYGLAQSLKIDPKVAKQYIDTYFANYQGVANYLTTTKREIREQGYVTTLFGRRREIPEIHASNAIVRAAAERMAINAPAQGTGADLIKLAMIHVHDWLEHTYANVASRPYLVLQVHDSLLLECPQAETERVATKVKELMEHVAELSVPLIVDCSVGPTWGDLVVTDPA